MAPLEKEASHREKILTDASVRLALIKRRLEPARSQLAALTARRDGVLDEMAGLVSPKKAPSGVLPPASTDAAILKEGKNLAEAPSAPTETLTDLSRKQAEYAEELADLGYYEEKRAQDLAVLETPEPAVDLSKRFKIDGELRIDNNDTSNHHAVDPERKRIQFPDDRLRLRARIYMDYNLDNNWHAIGMLESEKALHGDDSMNGTIDLDRYYLKGAVGKVMVMAGAFGKTLAEGNIYDSRFKGIQVAYGDHHPWYYEGAFGKVNEADEVTALTAIYQKGEHKLSLGAYGFRMDGGNNRNIGMLGYEMPLGGWWRVGAQYLLGHDETEPGGSDVYPKNWTHIN